MNKFDHLNFSFLNNPKLVFKAHRLAKFPRGKIDLKSKQFEKFDFINQKYFLKDDETTEANVKEKKTNQTGKKVSISVFTPDQNGKLENFTNFIKPINDSTSPISSLSKHDDEESAKPKSVLVNDILILERENTNPYFWYYKKKIDCIRDSTKTRNKNFLPVLQTRSNTRESGIKSILKDCEPKRVNDLANHAFTEFKSLCSNDKEEKKFNFKPKKMSEKCENYYKIDQESLNSRNFVQIEKPKTPQIVTKLSEAPKTILKVVKEEEIEFKPNILSFAELKKLKIDDRYLNDAQQMIFNPETNSFEHYEFYHLFK
jgi:hypothetical protein